MDIVVDMVAEVMEEVTEDEVGVVVTTVNCFINNRQMNTLKTFVSKY